MLFSKATRCSGKLREKLWTALQHVDHREFIVGPEESSRVKDTVALEHTGNWMRTVSRVLIGDQLHVASIPGSVQLPHSLFAIKLTI